MRIIRSAGTIKYKTSQVGMSQAQLTGPASVQCLQLRLVTVQEADQAALATELQLLEKSLAELAHVLPLRGRDCRQLSPAASAQSGAATQAGIEGASEDVNSTAPAVAAVQPSEGDRCRGLQLMASDVQQLVQVGGGEIKH